MTNVAYVSDRFGNAVIAINGATGATTTIPAGTTPSAVAINPVTNMVYVANTGSGDVTVINGSTQAAVQVPVGSNPQTLDVNPVSNKVFVGGTPMYEIDGATNAATALSVSAGAVVVNPVTNRVYGATYGTSTFSCDRRGDRPGHAGERRPGSVQPCREPGDQQGVRHRHRRRQRHGHRRGHQCPHDRACRRRAVRARAEPGDQHGLCGQRRGGERDGDRRGNERDNDRARRADAGVRVRESRHEQDLCRRRCGRERDGDRRGDEHDEDPCRGRQSLGYRGESGDRHGLRDKRVCGDCDLVTEQNVQNVPLVATIAALAGNQSSNPSPSFTFGAQSLFTPNAPTPQDVFFQLDSWRTRGRLRPPAAGRSAPPCRLNHLASTSSTLSRTTARTPR